jgi:hypothetical protein
MTSRQPDHPDQDMAEPVPFRMAAAVLTAQSRAPGRAGLRTGQTECGAAHPHEAFWEMSHSAAVSHEMPDQRNRGHNQQQMDQSACNVEHDPAEDPADQEYEKQSEKH